MDRLMECKRKEEVLSKDDGARGWKAKLLLKAGLRENSPSNVMPLTLEESDLLMHLGWQSWDYQFEMVRCIVLISIKQIML
jgi:hypothetical protein